MYTWMVFGRTFEPAYQVHRDVIRLKCLIGKPLQIGCYPRSCEL